MTDENVKKNMMKENPDDRELCPEELEQGAGGGVGPIPGKPGIKIPVTPKYPQPGQEEGRDDE